MKRQFAKSKALRTFIYLDGYFRERRSYIPAWVADRKLESF